MPSVPSDSTATVVAYKIKPYAKSIAAFVIGGMLFVLNLLSAGTWTAADTYALVTWIGTTLGVYTIPNKDTGKTGQVN